MFFIFNVIIQAIGISFTRPVEINDENYNKLLRLTDIYYDNHIYVQGQYIGIMLLILISCYRNVYTLTATLLEYLVIILFMSICWNQIVYNSDFKLLIKNCDSKKLVNTTYGYVMTYNNTLAPSCSLKKLNSLSIILASIIFSCIGFIFDLFIFCSFREPNEVKKTETIDIV